MNEEEEEEVLDAELGVGPREPQSRDDWVRELERRADVRLPAEVRPVLAEAFARSVDPTLLLRQLLARLAEVSLSARSALETRSALMSMMEAGADEPAPGEGHGTEDQHAPDDPAEAQPQRPSQPRKRFRAATEEELDPQSFMVADDRSALRAVLRGGSISKDRGDADFIGGAIRRLARALREAARSHHRAGADFIGVPQLRPVHFGASVIIELEISPEEQVDRGLDNSRKSPTIDGARDLAGLLSAQPDKLVERALPLGPAAVAEYKRFLDLLGSDEVTLEWHVPDATEVVVVSSADARQDFAILDREGERATGTVRVPGTLTLLGSRRHRFELLLIPGQERPPLLKHKSVVEGTYTEELGARLKAEGLWDSDVIATIEVEHDVPGTTPVPRESTYTLLDAEPLIPVVTLSMFE